MKNTGSEILNLFVGYLAKDVSLDEFQERIALVHWNVENAAPEMSKLVYKAVGKLAELSRGHRTEQSLRQELAAAIRPFVAVGHDGNPRSCALRHSRNISFTDSATPPSTAEPISRYREIVYKIPSIGEEPRVAA
jgi:hypothetical protein